MTRTLPSKKGRIPAGVSVANVAEAYGISLRDLDRIKVNCSKSIFAFILTKKVYDV